MCVIGCKVGGRKFYDLNSGRRSELGEKNNNTIFKRGKGSEELRVHTYFFNLGAEGASGSDDDLGRSTAIQM